MKELNIYPKEEDKGTRIDVYLTKELGLTRSRIKSLIEQDKVLFNKKVVKKSGMLVNTGEIIVTIDKEKKLETLPQDIPLDIIYQDSDFAVINKAQGMVTHPSMGSPDKTLVNAVLYHIKDLSAINGVLRPGIVHRLDKDTSGALVVAKNNNAHLSLAKQIEERTAERYYVALLVGNIKEDEGTIDAPIARHRGDRKKMGIVESGKRAVTHYKVLERYIDYTLVQFQLETGRTHQIRVHAKHINHAVVGDITYGKKDSYGLSGQLLHAFKLAFNHPTTNERMVFEAPMPDYFTTVLEKIRKKYL